MKNNSVVADIVANQRKLERKRWFVILSFLAIGVVSLILDVMTGPAMLSVSEVVNALFGMGEVDKMTNNIVHNLRLPMALMALGRGNTGCRWSRIQTLLNTPYGKSLYIRHAAAAGFGASVVIAFGSFGLPVQLAVPIGAFVMTMLASGILFLFASKRRFNSEMLVLVGIALLFIFQSLLSLVQFISAPESRSKFCFGYLVA